jgi:PAS domain S-box-containing protein
MLFDQHDANPPRPRFLFWKALCLTVIVGGLACLSWRAHTYAVEQGHFRRQIAAFTKHLAHTLRSSTANGAARTVGIANARVKAIVMGESIPDNPDLVQSLTDIRGHVQAALVYVMNTSGLVVASTTYADQQSLTGNNYGFRPYAQAAMAGQCAIYPGLGITTGQRGIYYSAPVLARRTGLASPTVIGALVIKMPATFLDNTFRNCEDPIALISPSRRVFASNQPPWVNRRLPDTIPTISAARSTPAPPAPPATNAVIDLKITDSFTHLNGIRHATAVHHIPLDDPEGDWILLALRDTRAWAPPYVLVLVFLLAALVTNSCFATIYLWRRRRQLEAANLTATEAAAATYRTIFNATSDGLFVHEIGTNRLLDTNAEAQRLFQCTPEELTTFPAGRTPHYTFAEAQEWMRKAVTEGHQSFEWLAERKDGSLFWLWVDLQVYSINGKERLLAVFRDITQQKQEQDSLLQSHDALRVQVRQSYEQIQQLAAAVNQAEESILITTVDGVIEYANPYLLKHTGYTRDEVIGQHVRLFKSGKHPPAFYEELWQTLHARKTWRGHFINRRKDGALYEEEAAISPICSDAEDKRIVRFVAVKRDVTTECMLERQIRQSQKMAAIGQLAHKVAHDFTNALTMIHGHAEIIRRAVDKADDIHAHIDQVIEAVSRVTLLLAELMTFASPADLRKMPIRLHRAIDGIHEILRKSIDQSITLVVDTTATVGHVSIDEGQIGQAVLHLAINAAEAMPHGGTLTITTSRVDLEEPEISRLKTDLIDLPADFVGYGVITVADTGSGIPADRLNHIFEPFYTTKQDTHNAGLGLSTAYRIVAQHNGYITVESTLGAGATFRIFLPLTIPSARVSPTATG